MSNACMRVLGIDPGLRTTGFGLVERDGVRLRYVASGTIRTGAAALGDLPGRLKIIFDGVREVATRYEPTCASVEIVFVNVNPQSTLLLGQARGAALSALTAQALSVAEYTALQMKRAVGPAGAARSRCRNGQCDRPAGRPRAPADASALAILPRARSDELAASSAQSHSSRAPWR